MTFRTGICTCMTLNIFKIRAASFNGNMFDNFSFSYVFTVTYDWIFHYRPPFYYIVYAKNVSIPAHSAHCLFFMLSLFQRPTVLPWQKSRQGPQARTVGLSAANSLSCRGSRHSRSLPLAPNPAVLPRCLRHNPGAHRNITGAQPASGSGPASGVTGNAADHRRLKYGAQRLPPFAHGGHPINAVLCNHTNRKGPMQKNAESLLYPVVVPVMACPKNAAVHHLLHK